MSPAAEHPAHPQLRARRVAIDGAPDNIAFLSRRCIAYRPAEFTALRKIEIVGGARPLLATLMICDEDAVVAPDELGLAEPLFRRTGLAEGAPVSIAQAASPDSLEAVRRKIMGAEMTADEIDAIIRDIAAYRYAPMEIAAFLVSSASFMTTNELLALTNAMTRVGTRLAWPSSMIVDKHCIGGVPGNRTSMIVVPIVAAHGLLMPKTSSRAITSPAGTADTMEVLARVDLDTDEMRAVVAKANGCLVWGGRVQLSPADDVLISVERPLRIDTREQMVASILSKKASAGSTHLVLDIPVGPTAKIADHEQAMRLRKLFEFVADKMGLVVDIVFSDGSQPVGRGIGPVLEARDVMQVLQNDPGAPADLKERAIMLAGRVLEFDPAMRGGRGEERARALLASGAALASMERIIEAQGSPPGRTCLGEIVAEIPAPSSGVVVGMDCYRLARIARLAGAPIDKGAGVDLLAKIGDRVEKGAPLYRIHSCFRSDFDFAVGMASERAGVDIGVA